MVNTEPTTAKYQVKWSANNCSIFGSFYGNNKKELIKSANEIVTGNIFKGNNGSWSLYEVETETEIQDKIIRK